MEETIDDQDKKKRGRKVYENPTNKVNLYFRVNQAVQV